MKESNEVIDKILLQLDKNQLKESEDLRKECTTIKTSIKNLTESATGSRPAKQVGAWSSFQVTAQSKVSEAQHALRARLYKPSAQDIQRIEVAEELTSEFVKQVDAFYAKEWTAYRSKVEAARLSWFK